MAVKKIDVDKLLEAMEKYRDQLWEDPKVSATKFDHFQTAIYGCKCLVRDAAGLPRQREMAATK